MSPVSVSSFISSTTSALKDETTASTATLISSPNIISTFQTKLRRRPDCCSALNGLCLVTESVGILNHTADNAASFLH